MKVNERILAVDDEPGVLRFVKASLSLGGYEVFTAAGGEEALRLVKSEKPDIMLLDILMTPVNGFDVLKKLRAFSKIPVIAFTARNDIADAVLEAGADAFIDKPFKPDDLALKIRELLDRGKPGNVRV